MCVCVYIYIIYINSHLKTRIVIGLDRKRDSFEYANLDIETCQLGSKGIVRYPSKGLLTRDERPNSQLGQKLGGNFTSRGAIEIAKHDGNDLVMVGQVEKTGRIKRYPSQANDPIAIGLSHRPTQAGDQELKFDGALLQGTNRNTIS